MYAEKAVDPATNSLTLTAWSRRDTVHSLPPPLAAPDGPNRAVPRLAMRLLEIG